MSGIYFLLNKGKVVYIGQTINIKQRLLGHRNKKYDKVRFIPCDASLMNLYERRWIKRFNPRYNKKQGRPKHKDPKIPFATCLRQSVIDRLREIGVREKRSVAVLIEIAVEKKYIHEPFLIWPHEIERE